MQAIFNFFFFALFLMLIFSAGVILYGSLFRGGEVGLSAHAADPRRADFSA